MYPIPATIYPGRNFWWPFYGRVWGRIRGRTTCQSCGCNIGVHNSQLGIRLEERSILLFSLQNLISMTATKYPFRIKQQSRRIKLLIFSNLLPDVNGRGFHWGQE